MSATSCVRLDEQVARTSNLRNTKIGRDILTKNFPPKKLPQQKSAI